MQTVLRLPQVVERTGVSRTRIYEMMEAGRFPKPIKIGARAIAFIADEVDGWVADRMAEREAA